MFSLFFIDLILSHMISIFTAVLWKLRALLMSLCTLILLLRSTHQKKLCAFFIIFLESLFGSFHVLLALFFRVFRSPSYLFGLYFHIDHSIFKRNSWLRFWLLWLVTHQN